MATKQQGIDILLSEREYVPQVVQIQLLNDIAGILYEQLAVMKDSIPDLVKKYKFNITDSLTEIDEDIIPTLPWIAVTIFNDGADPVHIDINEYSGERDPLTGLLTDPSLASGDSLVIDMRASKIKKIYFVCDTGETATVRVYAACKSYRLKQREEVDI